MLFRSYPYLAISNRGAEAWADVMHSIHTLEMIQSGIKYIREISDEYARGKCIAWLLGYAAHVVADVTIHPIVELKVGPYEENKTAHRVCEMNQDAYIFMRLKLGAIGLSEHLDSGICACGNDVGKLDSDIKSLWSAMLNDVYTSMVQHNPPDLDGWHSGFKAVVDNIAEEGYRFIQIGRASCRERGCLYV